MSKVRQALVLVGGRGTRLGDLARDTPKPLMPIVGDVRFLDYLLANLAKHGVEDIVLLSGHLAHVVEERYAGKQIKGARIRVSVEPAPAGTAGALAFATDQLDDVFFMGNGDSLLDLDYRALAQTLGAADIGALALRRVEDSARFGSVEVDDGHITAFREKDPSRSGPGLISGGVYVLRRQILDLIDRTPCSIETDIFPALVAQRRLAAYETDGYFIDIGLPDTLDQARRTFPGLFGTPL